MFARVTVIKGEQTGKQEGEVVDSNTALNHEESKRRSLKKGA
jgi:hypothetical protein